MRDSINNLSINGQRPPLSPYPQIAFWLTLVVAFLFSTSARAQLMPQINWVQGPDTIVMGDELAEIHIDEKYLFARKSDAQKIIKASGNISSGKEIGLIYPKSDAGWLILFEYYDVGHVKDDDKDSIDADAILDSIIAGTEEANRQKRAQGHSALNVIGWYEEPFYDEETNNLVWAVLGEDEESGEQFVNYNTRLLGRGGYVAVTLVSPPEMLDETMEEIDYVLSNFEYLEGERYFDFTSGDKIAKYGLAALIAGGAGAAAAKLGLFAFLAKFLAKMGKAAVALVAGIAAAIGGAFKAVFGKKED